MGIDAAYGIGSLKQGVCTSTTRPASPYTGQVIFETDTKQTLVYSGAAWVMLTDADSPPGLELIKTATVTNAANTSTTWQGVFNSTYTSYRLICHNLNAHTNGAIPRMSFYYSTSTEQTTTYYSSVTNSIYNGTSNITSVNNGAFMSLGAACDNIGASSFSLDIHRVGLSGRGTVLIQYVDAYNGSWAAGGGLVATDRTYEGFKLFMSAGNISMTGSLYGYRK
jgi:hypothetical protein